MGDVIKGIGKVVSAPVRGLGHALHTSGIPGISNIGGVAENVGNAVAGKGGFFRDIGHAVGEGAPLALGALGGGLGLGLGGLSGLAGSIGKAITSPNMLGNQAGKLDLGKLIGAAGGISSIVGQHQQRKNAQNYTNTVNAQRNQLLSKILAPPDYNLPNLNQQSSATTGQ